MRYSLTGATGFVGGVLASQLCTAGHEVVALVRDPARAGALAGLGVELVAGDLADFAALRRLCEGCDGFFHVAGWYKIGSRNPAEGWRVNVDGTRNALTAASEAGVPRIVYTSTLAVNSDTRGVVVDESYQFSGDHISVYDETKAAAHEIAIEFAEAGAPIVTVMPGLVYGPGDTALSGTLIHNVLRGRRVLVPAGGGVCWGYIDDIATGHLQAMQRGVVGESYMLAGPRATLAEGLRRVAKLAGKKAPLVLPSAMVAASAPVARLIGRVLALPPQYAGETFRVGLATYLGTAQKANAELGWVCRDLDTGLRDTIAGGGMH